MSGDREQMVFARVGPPDQIKEERDEFVEQAARSLLFFGREEIGPVVADSGVVAEVLAVMRFDEVVPQISEKQAGQ